MAKFYPAEIRADAPEGEKDFWRALEALPDTYSVIWSWDFRFKQDNRWVHGEVDFIVVTPQHGVIAFEAKRGKMSFRDNTWWQNSHTSDCRAQAGRAGYAVHDQLEAAGLSSVPIRWSLAFTTTPAWSGLPNGVSEGQILFRPQCTPSRISEAMRRIIADVPAIRGPRGETPRGHQAIVRALIPDLGPRLAASLEATDHSLNALTMRKVAATNEQVEALAAMSAEESITGRHRVLVRGPAGSGKTLLALHHARKVAAESQPTKVLLLSPSGQFHRHLLSTKLDPTKLSIPRNVFVHDLRSLMEWGLRVAPIDLVDRLGKPPLRRPSDYNAAQWRARQAQWIGDIALELSDEHRYTHVIVDEAQDFDADMIAALELLTVNEGPMVLLADPRQRMLDGGEWRAPAGYYSYPLGHNLRNTAQIAQLVWRTNPEARPIPSAWKDGEVPQIIEVPPRTSASERVPAVIRRLRDNGVSARDIAVLTAGRRADPIVSALRAAGIEASRTSGDDASEEGGGGRNGVTVTNAQDFKGREVRVSVVVLGHRGSFTYEPGEENDEDVRLFRSQAYVALSRARGHMVVLGTPEQMDVLDPDRSLRGPLDCNAQPAKSDAALSTLP